MWSRRSLLTGVLSLAAGGCDSSRIPEYIHKASGRPERLRRERTRQQIEATAVCPTNLAADQPSRDLEVFALSGLHWADLSPDGQTIAVRADRQLHFVPVGWGRSKSHPLGGPSFGIADAEGSLAWSSDSSGVWLLQGETTKAGWTIGSLTCSRRTRDGRLIQQPPLRGLPARLDRVTWVNGDGLGIAHCDLRGGYYRPELPDANPSLAVIDAATGRARSPLMLRDAITRAWGPGPADGEVQATVLAATQLKDGRVRAVLSCWFARTGPETPNGGLAIWTEGERLRPVPRAIGDRHAAFEVLPGGERILVAWPLSASGAILELEPSPPPTPQTGPYATLFDLAWRPIWTRSGTASDIRSTSPMAISRNGRYGLLRLPENCGTSEVLGVIDLRDGAIKRRLKAPASRHLEYVGFRGQTPWAAAYRTLLFFAD